jgi:hypothetical protein
VVEIREYIDANGRSPFAKWFDGLNAQAAAKVTTRMSRALERVFSSIG